MLTCNPEDEDEQVDTNAAMPEGEEDYILETQPQQSQYFVEGEESNTQSDESTDSKGEGIEPIDTDNLFPLP